MKIDRRRFSKFVALGAVEASRQSSIFATPLRASDWPGWRGPERTAYVERTDWPRSLGEDHLVVQWQKPLGESYSGPIVMGNRVVVTESVKPDEQVKCFDKAQGELLWSASWSGSMSVPFFAASNGSWIRSTPVTDGRFVFVGGMRDVLVCLDIATGEKKYTLDFVDMFKSPLPAFGQVCSPLLDDGKLYLQSGGGLLCLRADSGEVIWRTMESEDGMMSSAFSSPIIVSLHGRRQLLVQTRSELCGVDLETGKPFWQYKIASFRGMNILTPTVWNDCVFTSSYGGKSLMLEFESPSNGALWSVREKWSAKAEGYMSTPVLIEDHLYLHLRNQRLVCLDAATGEERWRTRPYGKYWSMVTNGRQILALDEQGKLLLVDASPESFQLVDERKVSDSECWAHLALCGKQVFIRSLDSLSVYDWA